jgi:hypothetical protein
MKAGNALFYRFFSKKGLRGRFFRSAIQKKMAGTLFFGKNDSFLAGIMLYYSIAFSQSQNIKE